MHSHGCRNDDAADITAITEQSSFRVSDLLRPSDAYRAGGQSGASQKHPACLNAAAAAIGRTDLSDYRKFPSHEVTMGSHIVDPNPG